MSKYITIKFYLMFLVCVCVVNGYGHVNRRKSKLKTVFEWNQIGYDFDGVCYRSNTDEECHPNDESSNELKDSDKFFIQYNNVPIGLEVYGQRVFVTVPRRRYGIPSTLNYVDRSSSSPLLKPYPDVSGIPDLVSVYRPRVDACGRLWVVDTGLLEVPNERKQIQQPAIIVFDLHTDKQILRYELKPSDLVNERTSAGLTSITVDVSPNACDDAYAYINDLATEGLVVFSMKQNDSWRVTHESFVHEESALDFSVAGFTINWKDGLFSVALSDVDADGNRLAYFHPLVSTKEFSVDTKFLKDKTAVIEGHVQHVGSRGLNSQSGSHAYHSRSNTLLFANVAQDAILCWNVDEELKPETVGIVLQDHQKLVYISDLKIVGDDVWVLVNQIPKFIYSTLNPNETNYYIHRANIRDLIRGTVCERK